jgi:hypothetical protein
MYESNCENSESDSCKSKRQRVFALLDENSFLTAKTLCEKLGLSYEKHGSYLGNLKSQWNSNHQNEQGSNCSSVHAWRGWCCVPKYVDRAFALEVGFLICHFKN